MMKWLVILVVAELVTASDFKLGDRIIATEKECSRIKDLIDNWSTRDIPEEAAQFMDLQIICEDSLNEDKNKYIEENKIDLSWYPDKFEIETSDGKKFVTKPSPKQHELLNIESAKEIMSKYMTKEGPMNPIYRLLHHQSEVGQAIVDKQVECEELSLDALKTPADESSIQKHNNCLTDLNCMKQSFMEQRGFTRGHYAENFPIMYKQRGVVIKTPPMFDNSVCKITESAEENKGELERWMSGVELIGEKIANIGEAGSGFIDKLVKKGRSGEQKILTREELAELLGNAESVTFSDLDEDETEGNKNDSTLKVYGDLITEKLSELEAKGVKIVYNKFEKAKPIIAQNMAITEGNLIENVRDGLSVAGNVATMATAIVKEEGTKLMNKLMAKSPDHGRKVDSTETSSDKEVENKNDHQTVLETLFDQVVNPKPTLGQDDVKAPSPLQILKDISGHQGNEEVKQSDDELKESLRSLRESTKKRVENIQLSRNDVLQSAEIVKGVINTILSAASKGYGAAKDMLPNEIEKAKALVNELVNYATEEILGDKDSNNDEEEEEDEDDDENEDEDEKEPEENSENTQSPLQDDDTATSNEEQTAMPTTSDQVTNEDQSATPNEQSKQSDQTEEQTKEDEDISLSTSVGDEKTVEEEALAQKNEQNQNTTPNEENVKPDQTEVNTKEEEDKSLSQPASEEKTVEEEAVAQKDEQNQNTTPNEDNMKPDQTEVHTKEEEDKSLSKPASDEKTVEGEALTQENKQNQNITPNEQSIQSDQPEVHTNEEEDKSLSKPVSEEKTIVENTPAQEPHVIGIN